MLLWMTSCSCWKGEVVELMDEAGRRLVSTLQSHVARWSVSGGQRRWNRPNKTKMFTNIQVTSLMLSFSFLFCLFFLQSNAKQCTYSINHPKAWIRSGFYQRVLIKTLVCAQFFMHGFVFSSRPVSTQCLWEVNLFKSGSS